MARRRWLLFALAVLAVGAVLLLVRWRGQSLPPPPFPEDADVESVTACLFEGQWGGPAVPDFTVPPEYVPRLLRAFRPVTRSKYPEQWELDTLGRLLIRDRSGRVYTATFCFAGKNPLCYNLDGVRCGRGGPYRPVIVDPSSNFEGYSAEAFALAGAIRELEQIARAGKAPVNLIGCFEALEVSAGLLPPRGAQQNR